MNRVRRSMVIFVVAAAAAGCPGRKSSSPEKGFVLAKVITAESELIGGPRAEGRLGDLLLQNDRVRVIVGAAGNAPAFNLYGGSLLDADVVRPEGEPGFDLFGEAFPSLNVITLASDPTVEVAEPGCAGDADPECAVRRASVRVRGTGLRFPLLPEIPGLTNPVAAEMETTYTLEAGAASVLVETKVTLLEDERTVVQCFDILLFGSGLDPFGAPRGPGDTGEFAWFGADASRVAPGGTRQSVAYGWMALSPDATMQIPFADAAQQVAILGALEIDAGKSKTYARRFVIGRDLGDVAAEVARVRGRPTGTFAGIVNDSRGEPVPDALISVRAQGVDADEDGEDDFVSRIRTGADGSFTSLLPTGTYSATVSAPGGEGDPLADIPISRGDVSQAIFVVPATASIVATPSQPVRLTLVDGGDIVARGLYGAPVERPISALPGSYTLFVSRGPEWTLAEIPVTLTLGSALVLSAEDLALERVVDTTGFVAGDYHLHSVLSRDSGVPLEERALSLATEGLEYVALTDHERVSALQPAVEAQGLDDVLYAMAGDEISIPLYGHFNAYPMPDAAIETREYDGTLFWFDAVENTRVTADELIDRLRAIPGDRIVQINHPRDGSIKGYLDAIDYDPATGVGAIEAISTGFDTIEVNSRYRDEEGETLRDWFSLLRRGEHVTAVGVSDSHSTWDPGYPRTLVHVGTDDPAAVDEAVFVAALRAGRAVVSSGPFVVTSASSGAASAGLGDVLDASAGGGEVTLSVHVQSPAWAVYDTIAVYENGVLASTRPVTPALAGGLYESFEDFVFTPAEDVFYVVVVTGPGSLFPVSGQGVYAYTNPVYVDLGGDGWDPPE